MISKQKRKISLNIPLYCSICDNEIIDEVYTKCGKCDYIYCNTIDCQEEKTKHQEEDCLEMGNFESDNCKDIVLWRFHRRIRHNKKISTLLTQMTNKIYGKKHRRGFWLVEFDNVEECLYKNNNISFQFIFLEENEDHKEKKDDDNLKDLYKAVYEDHDPNQDTVVLACIQNDSENPEDDEKNDDNYVQKIYVHDPLIPFEESDEHDDEILNFINFLTSN